MDISILLLLQSLAIHVVIGNACVQKFAHQPLNGYDCNTSYNHVNTLVGFQEQSTSAHACMYISHNENRNKLPKSDHINNYSDGL